MTAFLFVISTILGINNAYHYFDRPEAYDHQCNVMDYGAKGDGKTNDTSSIQKAIDDCLGKGSSAQIVLPESKTFLVGPLSLTKKCENCAFTIEKDATLLVSNDRSKWPTNVDFLTINDLDKFVFEGPGIIEGQGLVWWQNRNDFRPRIMNAHSCNGVVVTDVTIRNCPNHCLEMYTDSTEISNIEIYNPPSELKNSDQESHTTGLYIHLTLI